MRKLVAGTFLTLDGVMQAPGARDEDRDGGFRHGGWLAPYFDETLDRVMTEWIQGAGAFLLGRRTYDIFAAYWPGSTDPADEIATALNARPKFVASRTLRELAWNNSHLLKGDVAEQVATLKAQEGGEIQVHGSGNLLQTLFRHDLIDTLRLWHFPVSLGTGKRLFGEGTIPKSFRLVETVRTTTDAVLHVYERAGDLRYGEVGKEAVIRDSGAVPAVTPDSGRPRVSRRATKGRMFAIKAEVSRPRAATYAFDAQKTMYGGRRIARGDTIFVFASENEGGPGLVARGVVTRAEATPRKRGVARQTPRVSIAVRRTALARRRLGRSELKPFTDRNDGRPETELNFKFYRQATNKVVGISDEAAAFLRGFF
jgi:dihydrofolate reductase